MLPFEVRVCVVRLVFSVVLLTVVRVGNGIIVRGVRLCLLLLLLPLVRRFLLGVTSLVVLSVLVWLIIVFSTCG